MFVLDFIFNGFTTIPFNTTTDATTFTQFTGAKINYGEQVINLDEIRIMPNGLLEESNFKPLVPAIVWHESTPILFQRIVNKDKSSYYFDLFAAIFFMLSRYEEYGSLAKDEFGRFPAKESLAYKNNFLHLPIVDIWLKEFLELVTSKYPFIIFPTKKTQVNFTYDIDVAFAYKGRSLSRNFAAISNDIVKGRLKRQLERLKVLLGLIKDPFDNYDYIAKTGINPIFFFLLHNKLSAQDRNISPKNKLLRSLIQRIQQQFPIGIHPSFYSSTKTYLLRSEKDILKQISGQKITKSRQHYLRFTWPYTYQQLVGNGILEEYSMGYTQLPGFRAGTCSPFYFFDLHKNEATTMKIFPMCIMESTFRDHMKVPIQKALDYFIEYFKAVKNVQGHFICIWHNDTLTPNNNLNDPKNFRWLHGQLAEYIRNFEL